MTLISRCGFPALLLLLAACGGTHADSTATGPEQDWVVQTTFDKAFHVVQGVDYLPFQYKVDGCYARALYMSMELAAQGMESNAVFAFARPGTALKVGSIQWGYHVAPMLEVGADAQHLVHMVIDPALSTKPLSQDEWVADMGFQPADPRHPRMLFVPGSDYAPAEAMNDTAHKNQDTPDFTHLPPFKAGDVQSACGVMWSYIKLEPGSTPDTIQKKQDKLVTRSGELVDALRAAGKLTAGAAFSPDTCRAGAQP
jgi:hypothetical protein